MDMNPNAKVILTLRDTPEAWVNSANQTIMPQAFEDPFRSGILYHGLKWVPLLGNMVRVFNMHEQNFNKCAVTMAYPKHPENRKKYYEDWAAYLKETISADRILIFNVKEGWKPLCDHLGKTIPSGPFPRANSTGLSLLGVF